MAPQTSIPLAANVLGTIGTILWCIQLLPQIWHSYRTKSVEGLPAAMMLTWSLSGLPFGVYTILQNFNIPLQIQPQCFCLLCGVSWAQCMYYGRKWRAWVSALVLTVILVVVAVLEAVFVIIIRGPYSRGVSWPVTTMGIIACVVLISGCLPLPFELIKRRGRCIGINFWFLLMDSSGAFFSLMSLVAQNTFDVEFGTLYALCCSIEWGVFLSHGIWLLRTRKLRRKAKEADCPFDDFPEAREWQEQGFKWEGMMEKGRSWLGMYRQRQCQDEPREPDLASAEEIELSSKLA